LVPVFTAHDQLDVSALPVALAKTAASHGETVLLLDLDGGSLMDAAGIVVGVTLGDVLYRGADMRDAKYVSHNEHFTAASAGDANLEAMLGSMAALSLGYDWVFVGTRAGCTPAHVQLARAADAALLSYSSHSDKFMRAYWMLDAIRARAPKFDPMMVVYGDQADCFETYDMFAATVDEFLGAAPALGGVVDVQNSATSSAKEIAPALLEALRQETHRIRKTA
jgi:MinD-like ATPase involved in chromosome partitioning or flagellar assembly